MSDKTCSISGCGKRHLAKGYCGMHYARINRNGSATEVIRQRGTPLEDRLWFHTVVVGECWESRRGLTRRVREGEDGYPGIRIGDTMVPVHLASYRLFKGEIPEGHQVHHECDNKRCWRPKHLVALTALEHKRAHHKTECKHGHLFTPENTREYIDSTGGLRRVCRACVRESSRARRRAAAL